MAAPLMHMGSTSPAPGSPWLDGPGRYGRVTRILHWAMAALFLWQFVGMALRLIFGRTPLVVFFVGTHAPLGFVLLILVVVRIGWALANRQRRPHHAVGMGGFLTRLGQGALYLLMLIVPALALLRLYGSGRGFSPFGITVFRKRDGRIEALMEPADALHGPLAWLLLLLIGGHVFMAIFHAAVLRDDVLRRMF